MTRIVAPWLQDAASQSVCALLEGAGHQALFVGGCVRNTLLAAPVTDLDIATDATPQKVLDLAEAAGLKSVPTGFDHGTVTVIADHKPFEITTFRHDVETDGRRAVVAFADNVTDDARRRDFTMNALYCDAAGQLHDPLGGLPDLHARRVRFIEDPSQRIREDYLRILRFFRFHAWYGDPSAGIDADGLSACAELADGIAGLSRERIGAEMLKLLSAADPAPALAAMAACGALWRVVPGAATDAVAVLVHIEQSLNLPPDPMRRLALLGGEDVADRLRLSKADAARLALLQTATGGPGELGYRHGATVARDVLLVRAALVGRMPDADDLDTARAGAGQSFPLTAADLMPRLQGPALGQALKRAEDRWIASGFTLSRDDLLA